MNNIKEQAQEIMNSGRAYCEMSEDDLRVIAQYRLSQYSKASDRFDKFGSIQCQGQAEGYLMKYAEILNIIFQNGGTLTEEEKEIVSLKVRKI